MSKLLVGTKYENINMDEIWKDKALKSLEKNIDSTKHTNTLVIINCDSECVQKYYIAYVCKELNKKYPETNFVVYIIYNGDKLKYKRPHDILSLNDNVQEYYLFGDVIKESKIINSDCTSEYDLYKDFENKYDHIIEYRIIRNTSESSSVILEKLKSNALSFCVVEEIK